MQRIELSRHCFPNRTRGALDCLASCHLRDSTVPRLDGDRPHSIDWEIGSGADHANPRHPGAGRIGQRRCAGSAMAGCRWCARSIPLRLIVLNVALSFSVSPSRGTLVKPALPPRGWNSYDSVSAGGNASYIRQQAAVLEANWLPASNGRWTWLTIDAGWFSDQATEWNPKETTRIDAFGRPVASARFGVDGDMKALADAVHARGLQFGLWYMGGLPAEAVEHDTPIKGTNYTARNLYTNTTYCPRWAAGWGYEVDHDHPAAQAWFDSLVELWTEWGIDLIKLDCANAEDEEWRHRLDIIRLSQAMEASSQPFVLSLSPGGFSNISQILDIRPYVSMARATDDFWDEWQMYISEGGGDGWASGVSHWDAARDLVAAVQPDSDGQGTFWIDLDMLPFGRIGHGAPCPQPFAGVGPGCSRQSRFTTSEERSILTLWAFAHSPLLVGGDLRTMDRTTMQTLQHSAVLAMADDLGESWEALRHNDTSSGGGYIVWAAAAKVKSVYRYFAIFNLANATRNVTRIPAEQLGLDAKQVYTIENLWRGDKWEGRVPHLLSTGPLEPHGVQLIKVTSMHAIVP